MDAMGCLIDGRNCAASFFFKQAKLPSDNGKNYQLLAESFLKCAKTIEKMWALYEPVSDVEVWQLQTIGKFAAAICMKKI